MNSNHVIFYLLSETATPAFVPNESIVMQLMEMGFPQARCVKAVFHTKNAGIEEASNWLFSHMGDPDIDEPLVLEQPKSSTSSSSSAVNEESVAMLVSMGFTTEKATQALKSTNNDLERATEWIFSHADDPEPAPASSSNAASSSHATPAGVKDGPGQYNLKAIISHMGTSAMSGHYVCHIKKDGKWILFNDNKVALSENPPRDMGYLYLFERDNSK
jgi:ubiquitin carboxyl-terminal hydrolase 5/13